MDEETRKIVREEIAHSWEWFSGHCKYSFNVKPTFEGFMNVMYSSEPAVYEDAKKWAATQERINP